MIEASASSDRRRTDGECFHFARDVQPEDYVGIRRNVLKLPSVPAVDCVRRVAIPADSPAHICVDEINLGNSRSKTLIRQYYLLPSRAAVRRAITDTADAYHPSVIRVNKINRISHVREYRRPSRAAVGCAKQTFRDARTIADNVAEIAVDKFHVADEILARQIRIAD